jgi:hypothetical protein
MRAGGFLSFLLHLAILLLILLGLPDMFRQEEVAAPLAVQLATLADITAQPKLQPTPTPVVKQETPPPPAPAPPVPPTPPTPAPQPVEQQPPPEPAPPPPQPEPPAPQPVEQTPPEPVPIPDQQPTPPPPEEAKLEAPPPPVLRPPQPPDKPKPKPAQQAQDFNSLLKSVEKLKTTTPDTQQPQPDQPPQPDQSASNLSAPQLTSSEVDAVKSQISGCWIFDVGARGVGEMTVDVRVALAPDGTVKTVQADGGTRMAVDPIYRSFVEATVRAVWKCSPLRVPLNKYDTWKQLLLHFDPSGMIG